MNEELPNTSALAAGIKAAIEALLFISEKSLLIDQIKGVFENLEPTKIREVILELQNDYENSTRGLRITEVAGGFQIVTSLEVADTLKKFYKLRDAARLSKSALETLAIIAYKQPVTRLDIESLRGVNVDGVMRSLLEKNLIRITGRKDVIGRPFVYGTTRQFLEYFGLASLGDLPKIEDFAKNAESAAHMLSVSNRTEAFIADAQKALTGTVISALPQEETAPRLKESTTRNREGSSE